MTALDWAIQSSDGLQWPCANRETAEAAQHTNPKMTILCRKPGGVWRVAEVSAAPVSELARLRAENETLRARVAELEDAAAQRLAADFEAMRVALLAKSHPEVAHDWLDADDDTAFPLPGVAHPKAEGLAS